MPAHAVAASGQVVRQYITVDDGTQISVAIWEPSGFDPTGNSGKWPALFEMDGYGGAPNPDDEEFFNHTSKYVVVYAQIRGTGCSGGQLDLFSPRSSQDGKFIINNWIEQQPWSNGNVGITGHSYSGLTAFLVAGTTPNVKAVAVSGLIDDFYRSILYPGGVFNEGFPVLWGALLRPFDQFSGNSQNYTSDPQCVQNEAQHQGSDTVPAQLIAPVYTQMTADPSSWALQHSLFHSESGINVPTQINQQYQDEQTGPRGGYILWQNLPNAPAKRLVVSNGQHNPNDPAGDKGAWLDCWILDNGQGCPTVTGQESSTGQNVTVPVNDAGHRVLMYFDSLSGGSAGQQRNTPYLTSDWPAPETNWQRYYLNGNHTISTSPGPDGSVSYASTTTDEHTSGTLGNDLPVPPRGTNVAHVTFTHGPNEARWTLPFSQTTALSGPMLLDLWMSSTSVDTDVFADVLDLDPSTGQMEYLQRGLQRASFRTVDDARSDKIASGPLAGTIYRPYHDFLNRDLLTPGSPYELPVELFPLGHVFYPGHQLVIDLHAPPVNDPLSTYSFAPEQTPGLNTILQDAQHRSNLLLPLLPSLPPLWPTQPQCASIAGYVCFTPAAPSVGP